MFVNNHEKFIKMKRIPNNLRQDCLFPRIVPLITYQDNTNNQHIDEILNATCKNRFCFVSDCPFKGFVDLDK